jgi:hypothetical protein
MELRQLTTESDRRIFAECLERARDTRGMSFRETVTSRLGAAHLAFGRVYGIFQDSSAATEAMLGGFILHDLGTLPQSFPRPDLSSLPAKYIFEGSDFWSLSTGVGRIAGAVAGAVAGLLQARALLVYPIVRPVDLTERYTRFHFEKIGEPIPNGFGEGNDGSDLWVQPMLLTGEALASYVRFGLDTLFFTAEEHALRALPLHLPDLATPRTDRPTVSAAQSSKLSGPLNGHNGAAAS